MQKQIKIEIKTICEGTAHIHELIEIMEKAGISMDIDEEYLTITYDTNDVWHSYTRNAGRHRIESSNISVKEAEQMIRDSSAIETAKVLGISKATLYRRIKEAKESGNRYI